MTSPWARALGTDFEQLDAGLRTYFSEIPAGSVGRGSGVFTVVGTPRRWLWPVLAVLARDSIVFPVFERDVPFTVVNRRGPAGTVRATRIFQLASGERRMLDETGITGVGLVDRLGARGIVATTLRPSVLADGSLRLDSTGVTLRIGRIRLPLGCFSPRVRLSERREGDVQRVSLVLDAPAFGRLYEYEGHFTFQIEPE